MSYILILESSNDSYDYINNYILMITLIQIWNMHNFVYIFLNCLFMWDVFAVSDNNAFIFANLVVNPVL